MKIRSFPLCGIIAVALASAFAPLTFGEQKSAAYSDVEAGKHVGDEATVTGKIAGISKSGKGNVFLNFGEIGRAHV